jgi:hypothetical protein
VSHSRKRGSLVSERRCGLKGKKKRARGGAMLSTEEEADALEGGLALA